MADRLAVVVAGDDDELHIINALPGCVSWSGWVPLGAPPGERLVMPTLTSTPGGGLELFAFSTTHLGMWRRRHATPMGTWEDWEREPDPPGVTWDEGNIAVRQAHDGRLQMFCVNASDRKPPLSRPRNRVWHRQQESAHGSWTRWKQHGQPPNAQEIFTLMEMNLDGRLELIATVHTPLPEERFEMWRLRQKSPHGPWSQWELATDPTVPGQRYGPRAVCRGADGRLLAFGTLFGTMEVGHTSQGVPGGDWQPWASLGTPGGRPVSAVTAVLDRSGRPNVLALASDTAWEGPYRVWHLQQAGPGGSWSGWSPLGAPVTGIGSSGDELVAASTASGLHIFTVAMDGALWNRCLPAHGSQWSPWQTMGHPASTTQIFSPTVCATG